MTSGGGSAPQFKPPTAPEAPDLFNAEDLLKFGASGDVYNSAADVDRATILNTRMFGKEFFGDLFKANKIDMANILKEMGGYDPNAANARDDMLRAGLGDAAGALGGDYGINPYATGRNLGVSGVQYSQQLQDRAKSHLAQSLQSPLNQLTQVGYTGADFINTVLGKEKIENDFAVSKFNIESGTAGAALGAETASANSEAAANAGKVAAAATVVAAIVAAL